MRFTAFVVATFTLCLGIHGQVNDRAVRDLRVRSALVGDEDDLDLGLEARAAQEEIDWDILASLKARSPNPSFQARARYPELSAGVARVCLPLAGSGTAPYQLSRSPV